MRTLALLVAASSIAIATGAAAQPGGDPGAAGVVKVDGFVCPVIKTENVLNSPKGAEIAGDQYTIAGPHDLSIPIHATNADGAGTPMGYHASPGDTDYTAIWNQC